MGTIQLGFSFYKVILKFSCRQNSEIPINTTDCHSVVRVYPWFLTFCHKGFPLIENFSQSKPFVKNSSF